MPRSGTLRSPDPGSRPDTGPAASDRRKCTRERRGYRGGFSLPLELPEKVVGERGVEIVRHDERPGRQPERARRGTYPGHRPQFGDRPVAAGDEDGLAGLDPAEQGERVALEVL